MKRNLLLLICLSVSFTSCANGENNSSSSLNSSDEVSSSDIIAPGSESQSKFEEESSQFSSDSDSMISYSDSSETIESPIDIYVLEMAGIYGDSIFIKHENIDILIDAGWDSDGPYVKNFVNEHVSDGVLDLVVVTHPHGDHVGGMSIALSEISSVKNIIDYGTNPNPSSNENGLAGYENRKKELIEAGTVYHSAYQCVTEPQYKTLTFNEHFSVEVLNTGNYYTNGVATTSDPNGHSVSLLFKYGDFTFLTQGDLTSKVEATLLKNENLSEVTMYKASHHASAGSNSKALLDVISPKMVVISASRALNYMNRTDTSVNKTASSGHPQADAVQRIYESKYIKENLNVYWNMYAGTMKFSSYGTDEAVDMQGAGPERLGYYQSNNGVETLVTGEENLRFSETVVFKTRGYDSFLTSN